MAKQQAVTQVNPDVASLLGNEGADPVDVWGRPELGGSDNGIGL